MKGYEIVVKNVYIILDNDVWLNIIILLSLDVFLKLKIDRIVIIFLS